MIGKDAWFSEVLHVLCLWLGYICRYLYLSMLVSSLLVGGTYLTLEHSVSSDANQRGALSLFLSLCQFLISISQGECNLRCSTPNHVPNHVPDHVPDHAHPGLFTLDIGTINPLVTSFTSLTLPYLMAFV